MKVTKEIYHAFLEKEFAFFKEHPSCPQWVYAEAEIAIKIMKELYLLDSEELEDAETES